MVVQTQMSLEGGYREEDVLKNGKMNGTDARLCGGGGRERHAEGRSIPSHAGGGAKRRWVEGSHPLPSTFMWE